ncbi:MAG: zf-TFIIB domain-containing protein [Planctomycetota bacterium]
MNCPGCGHKLRQERYEGVTIDVCAGCGGVWLDEGELEQIVERRERAFAAEEVNRVPGAREPVMIRKEEMGEGCRCPICGTPCRRSNYAYTSGIIVDTCPRKDGVWLDESELEKIQIVVEEWEKKRGEIKGRFKPALNGINREVRARREESYEKMGRARFPLAGRLVNALVRGIVRLDE